MYDILESFKRTASGESLRSIEPQSSSEIRVTVGAVSRSEEESGVLLPPPNNGMDRSRASESLNPRECYVRGPVIPTLGG